MYYITRVELDTNNHQKIKRNHLNNLQSFHNMIEQSFPQDLPTSPDQKRIRHLWRIDPIKGHQFVLIISPSKPDVYKLYHYGGKPGTAQTKKYQPYIDSLQPNALMHFKLTANPSYQIEGHEWPHVTVRYQKMWFMQHTKKNGFIIPKNSQHRSLYELTHKAWPLLIHKDQNKLNHILLAQATYEGILKVTDIDKFKRALTFGIGREKAYGMGMLTVIPIRR